MNLGEFKEWVAGIEEDDDRIVYFESDCCVNTASGVYEVDGGTPKTIEFKIEKSWLDEEGV